VPPPAVYLVDGERLAPTTLAQGPWAAGFQHGGAPAALAARAIEAVPVDVPMQVCRLTVELLRPVPLSPLTVTADVVRPGRKVQLVEAVIRADDTPVVRAVALRVRTTDLPLPEGAVVDEGPLPPDSARPLTATAPGAVSGDGFITAMEIRSVTGGFEAPGPSTSWFRLRQPLVEGEEPSPLVRVAAAADFGNGISWVLPFDRYTSINPDLTVYLARPPEGEWVCLESRTFPRPSGIGMADTALYDVRGRIGRSVQTLVHEARS
jgi:hypothetical protein